MARRSFTFFIIQRKRGEYWDDQENLPELFRPEEAEKWCQHEDIINHLSDENYLSFATRRNAIDCLKAISADGDYRVMARLFKWDEWLVYPEPDGYLPPFPPFDEGNTDMTKAYGSS
jgi:hypothetical protein